MRNFANKITLIKNSRGVYDLDTSKGCLHGIRHNEKGCYNDCYAARYSKKYGYDFSKTILRNFDNKAHEQSIIRQINKIDMPFLRIGVTGDPSENWEHAVSICEKIAECNKEIVIITKHWRNLNINQLKRLSRLNVCINTSISALDKPKLLNNRLKQYKRLKKYCNSVLRIVSCEFNMKNEIGIKLNAVQSELFKNENVLDTILRVYNKNEYVINGIINIEKVKFLGKTCHISRYNKDTYFGECYACIEMCGINCN